MLNEDFRSTCYRDESYSSILKKNQTMIRDLSLKQNPNRESKIDRRPGFTESYLKRKWRNSMM